MKKYNRILSLLFLLLVSNLANSQSVSELRQVRYQALLLFEDYVSCTSKLERPDNYTEWEYTKLFDNRAEVYNDILPFNEQQFVSPQDYCDLYIRHEIKSSPEFSRLSFSFPQKRGGHWQIEIHFDKSAKIRYTTQDSVRQKETVVVTKETFVYPLVKHSYTMLVNVDLAAADEAAKICKISVSKPINQFFIINNTDSYLIVDSLNSPVESDSIIQGESPESMNFQIVGGEFWKKYNWETNRLDSHFYGIKSNKLNLFGLGVIGSPISFGEKSYLQEIRQNNDFVALEMFYGLQLAQKKRSTLLMNFKFNFGDIISSAKGNNYASYETFDADGDRYQRRINISSLNEQMNVLYASIPITFEYLVQLNSLEKKHPIFLSFELGGYVSARFYSTHKFAASVDYKGFYPQYFGGVEMDHYYDYGHYELSSKDISVQVKDKLKMLDYGLQGALGLYVAVNKANLLKFNVGYKYGFSPMLNYKENLLLTTDYHNFETAIQTNKNAIQNIYFGLSWVKVIGR